MLLKQNLIDSNDMTIRTNQDFDGLSLYKLHTGNVDFYIPVFYLGVHFYCSAVYVYSQYQFLRATSWSQLSQKARSLIESMQNDIGDRL